MTSLASGVTVTEPVGTRMPVRRRRPQQARSRQLIGLAMAAPGIVLIITFFVIPFHNWAMLGAHRWVGLANYQRAVQDPAFRSALKFTLIYTVVITPILF